MGTASDRDMPARFPSIVRANIPNASNESIASLQSMYSSTPGLPEKLAWDYTTDIVFGCPAANIAAAYADKARRYLFSVPPAYHGADIACESSLLRSRCHLTFCCRLFLWRQPYYTRRQSRTCMCCRKLSPAVHVPQRPYWVPRILCRPIE